MGSKEEDVPVEPSEKTVFMEDMNESELATAVSKFLFYFKVFIIYNHLMVFLNTKYEIKHHLRKNYYVFIFQARIASWFDKFG